MDQNKLRPRIVAALTLLLAAALCIAVLSVYFEGTARRAALGSATEPIFTREIVGRRLLWAAPLAVLWLAATVVTRRGKPAPVPSRENALRLARLRGEEAPAEAAKEQRLQRCLRRASVVWAALMAAWALHWLLNGAGFQSWDLEAVMGTLLRRILPPLALGFAGLLIFARLREASCRRELDLWRGAPKWEAGQKARHPLPGQRETKARRGLRIALLAAAVVLIVLGVQNGGLNDVLVKAINICTECIGLG